MPNPEDRIAFVMGLGRSGTTFLAKLIDSSPRVLYRHEPDALAPSDIPSLLNRGDLEGHLPKARAYVEAMAACRKTRASCHAPTFDKAYRSAFGNFLFPPLAYCSKAAERLGLPLPGGAPDMIRRHRGEIVYLIKSVSSLGRAALYRRAVPGVRYVHILRHPCAVYASLQVGVEKGVMAPDVFLNALFGLEEAARYPFSRREMENASFEEQVAFRWMLLNDKAAADMADSPDYLRIRYEDLCSDVDRVSRQVFDHLGIEIDGQTRRFIDSLRQAPGERRAKPGYFKVTRPIMSAVDKWRARLDPESVERMRRVVSCSALGRAYFEDH
jgi:hypothetical protein